MLKTNKNECLNIQEQVLKNANDIQALKYGLIVDDHVDTEEQLVDAICQFGHAVAVGTVAPYDYHIKLRDGTFLNAGKLEGPEGSQGLKGDKGEQGQASVWWYGYDEPTTDMNPKEHDMYMNTLNGNVYSFVNGKWSQIVDLRGPQGIQGQKGRQGDKGDKGDVGPQGEVGPAIQIIGEVSDYNKLPSPYIVPRNSGYLVGSDNPKQIYVVSGLNTLTWVLLGNFTNIAIGETSGTAYDGLKGKQNADNIADLQNDINHISAIDIVNLENDKLDKVKEQHKVYGTDGLGNQTTLQYNVDPFGNDIVERTAEGRVKGTTPLEDDDLVNKKYFDENSSGTITITNMNQLDTYKTEGLYKVVLAQTVSSVEIKTPFNLFVFSGYEGKKVTSQIRSSRDGYYKRVLSPDNVNWGNWEHKKYSVDGTTQWIAGTSYDIGAVVSATINGDYCAVVSTIKNNNTNPEDHPENWIRLDTALQGGGGTKVEANNGQAATTPLETLLVGDTNYQIPAGGGGGTEVIWEGRVYQSGYQVQLKLPEIGKKCRKYNFLLVNAYNNEIKQNVDNYWFCHKTSPKKYETTPQILYYNDKNELLKYTAAFFVYDDDFVYINFAKPYSRQDGSEGNYQLNGASFINEIIGYK